MIISKDKSDIEIVGSGLSTSNLSSFEREDMTSWNSTKKAAEIAYKEAKIGPKEIHIAEIHDAFTPVELISYEDLGFIEKGKGAAVIDGVTHKVKGGDCVIVPAGAVHNVTNTGEKPLHLYTLYSPPEHMDHLVQKTKAEAEASHEAFDGVATE